MLVDRAHVLLEKFRHVFLGQPDGFRLQPDLQPRPAIFGPVKQEFAAGRVGVGTLSGLVLHEIKGALLASSCLLFLNLFEARKAVSAPDL